MKVANCETKDLEKITERELWCAKDFNHAVSSFIFGDFIIKREVNFGGLMERLRKDIVSTGDPRDCNILNYYDNKKDAEIESCKEIISTCKVLTEKAEKKLKQINFVNKVAGSTHDK